MLSAKLKKKRKKRAKETEENRRKRKTLMLQLARQWVVGREGGVADIRGV